jgi:hypothetical protein
MRAIQFCLAVVLGLTIVAGRPAPMTAATTIKPIHITPGKAAQPISLRDRLVVGLQARLKSEVDFCNAVVVQVHLGHLPLRVVDETFLWARQRSGPARNGIKYRPIIYFQPAMRLRAAKLHVAL